MRVLLDNCVNHRCAAFLEDHDVVHARELGWGDLSNGKLLAAAEAEGFAVLVTVDKSVRNQQNLTERSIILATLRSKSILIEDLAPLFLILAGQLMQPGFGQQGLDIVIEHP